MGGQSTRWWRGVASRGGPRPASCAWGAVLGIYALEDPNVTLEDPSAGSKFKLRWRIRRQDPNALYAGGSVLSPRGSVCKIKRVGFLFGTIYRTNVG
jgi:hypothetical protein